MKKKFKVSLDRYSNDKTVVITILFIAIIIGQTSFNLVENIISVSISVFLLGLYLQAFLFRPLSYEITNDFLIIHRLAHDISIPRKNLQKVDIMENEIKYTTISFRIAGFFGYFGTFASKQIGTFTMYATRRNKAVVIQTTDNKKVILTPDQPTQFVKQLRNYFLSCGTNDPSSANILNSRGTLNFGSCIAPGR